MSFSVNYSNKSSNYYMRNECGKTPDGLSRRYAVGTPLSTLSQQEPEIVKRCHSLWSLSASSLQLTSFSFALPSLPLSCICFLKLRNRGVIIKQFNL